MVLPAWVSGLKRPFQIGFAAAVLTAVFTLFMPNYYKSEARVLPIEAKGMGGGLGNLAAAAAAFGVSVPGGDGSDANFIDILNSRTLREKLLETE
ncbi:MAG TPA: Wzz/FepE/Etk N-terminal domain-containing protein, partial [Holophaga sp.]|nr:Wzz/FepE/Etk N-terminal domain-containing protein [Holophaga sp.]